MKRLFGLITVFFAFSVSAEVTTVRNDYRKGSFPYFKGQHSSIVSKENGQTIYTRFEDKNKKGEILRSTEWFEIDGHQVLTIVRKGEAITTLKQGIEHLKEDFYLCVRDRDENGRIDEITLWLDGFEKMRLFKEGEDSFFYPVPNTESEELRMDLFRELFGIGGKTTSTKLTPIKNKQNKS